MQPTPTPGQNDKETKGLKRAKHEEVTPMQVGGVSEFEKQLLMVDDKREDIMNMRDSNILGRYIIQEKIGYQHKEMED